MRRGDAGVGVDAASACCVVGAAGSVVLRTCQALPVDGDPPRLRDVGVAGLGPCPCCSRPGGPACVAGNLDRRGACESRRSIVGRSSGGHCHWKHPRGTGGCSADAAICRSAGVPARRGRFQVRRSDGGCGDACGDDRHVRHLRCQPRFVDRPCDHLVDMVAGRRDRNDRRRAAHPVLGVARRRGMDNAPSPRIVGPHPGTRGRLVISHSEAVSSPPDSPRSCWG